MDKKFLHFTLSVSKLNKQIQKLKTKGMQLFNLKGVHTLFLYQLSLNDGMDFSQITKACELNSALVSRMLKELCDNGLIKKVGEEGKYKAKYFLTDNAKKYTPVINSYIDSIQNYVSKDIDKEEIEIFYKVLNQLICNFEELTDKPYTIFKGE